MPKEKDISQLITDVAQKYNRGIDEVVTDFTTRVSQDIQDRTPVGQPSEWENPSSAPPGYVGGRARSNWFPTIDSPSNETTEETNADVTGRINSIKNQIAGNVYYLTNNLPYIRRLEYDNWSKQAPRGMVRVTLREALKELKRVISSNTR